MRREETQGKQTETNKRKKEEEEEGEQEGRVEEETTYGHF